jgi:hypothetical protein
MFGSLWLSIAGILGVALMVAAIVLISPLFLAVVICLVIVGGFVLFFGLGRAASGTAGAGDGSASRPQGAGSDTSSTSGGRPASGEGPGGTRPS